MSDSLHRRLRDASLAMFLGVLVVLVLLVVVGQFIPSSTSSTVVLIVGIPAAALVAWLVQQRMTRSTRMLVEQIERMTAIGQEISRGDLQRHIELADISVEELRRLAGAINAIATRTRSDIAEMKRLERVRSEFLGNVSHELRTPIFSVQGYLETLLDGAMDDPGVRDDFLQKAHQNVMRLHSLLADLIEISRIESGEMRMSTRIFDAIGFLNAIVEELRSTAQIAGVSIHFETVGRRDRDGEISVSGDRERLKQVMVNLIENAIKYNHPGGLVTVELEPINEERAVIRVRDTGIGIPPEHLARIFERFYRVDKDRSRAVGGSGLGLAIVKHIAEAHGSSVVVHSQPGAGSSFSFELKRG